MEVVGFQYGNVCWDADMATRTSSSDGDRENSTTERATGRGEVNDQRRRRRQRQLPPPSHLGVFHDREVRERAGRGNERPSLEPPSVSR